MDKHDDLSMKGSEQMEESVKNIYIGDILKRLNGLSHKEATEILQETIERLSSFCKLPVYEPEDDEPDDYKAG